MFNLENKNKRSFFKLKRLKTISYQFENCQAFVAKILHFDDIVELKMTRIAKAKHRIPMLVERIRFSDQNLNEIGETWLHSSILEGLDVVDSFDNSSYNININLLIYFSFHESKLVYVSGNILLMHMFRKIFKVLK